MVPYMERFLAEFQQAPYTVKKEGSSWYRITNTHSDFSAVVRPYRGEVYIREVNWDNDKEAPYIWKRITHGRLKQKLELCTPTE